MEYFKIHRRDYPAYKLIFIFDTDPKTTFSRRKDREAPENEWWMNENFMCFYREFYQNEVEKYTEAKVIRHEKDGHLETYYRSENLVDTKANFFYTKQNLRC